MAFEWKLLCGHVIYSLDRLWKPYTQSTHRVQGSTCTGKCQPTNLIDFLRLNADSLEELWKPTDLAYQCKHGERAIKKLMNDAVKQAEDPELSPLDILNSLLDKLEGLGSPDIHPVS